MQVQIEEFNTQKNNLCGELIVILFYFTSNSP